jgi:hypothetical protein
MGLSESVTLNPVDVCFFTPLIMRTEQIRHARHRLIGCFFFLSFLKDEQNKARDKLAGAKKTTETKTKV